MGRAPVSSRVSEEGLTTGPWTEEEDAILTAFIKANGEGNWRALPKLTGLRRCRKSCRLRWMNYLRPDLKRGNFSVDEDELIAKLHSLLGNRWSLIAGRIPGRTDNEIKNYWNSRLRRKLNATPPLNPVEATPISCSHMHLDSAHLEQSSPSTSTSFASKANQAIASPGEWSFPEYAEDFAASSSSLDEQMFFEYARFETSSEATPSEPSSSDGTACSDDHSCSDHQDDSTWIPVAPPVASDFSADSMKHESHAHSPESVLSQPGFHNLDSEEDFFCSDDFISFTNDAADLEDASFQMWLQFVPLSPMHKNLVSPECWPVDAFWL